MQRGNGPPWWRGAVIYQVYVRSFADGDGDGLGDLKGLIARLDHPRRLGVDALWLTPVHPSGGADGGYDVTDYLDVDPGYGDLHSFDRLVEISHARGLRILMDFVLNHTSDRHPWFVEAWSSRASPRRGWYTFAEGSPGRPPNNWESAFGGPAWIREERTDQWSLSSFHPGQRDLNWANPGVRGVMGEAMRFWLDRGVDGFRLDALHRIAKDPHLRDNPQPVAQEGLVLRRDQNGPAIHRYVQDIRRAVGGEPLLLGEVWMPDLEEVLSYVKPGQLDLAFNFPFALSRWEPGAMAEVLERTEALTREAWPCYHLSNHDMPAWPPDSDPAPSGRRRSCC